METRDFGMGFFGRMGFDNDARKGFMEKWSEMTTEEKVDFMDKKMESMKNEGHSHKGFFGNREFSVEAMDNFCEDWQKKTVEEKEEFIKSKKEMMQRHRDFHMNGFMGHRHGDFGFGRDENSPHQ